MDKKYIEDNEIEIKYLRNQLSSQELEEYEVYLMENPEALEEIELSVVLEGSVKTVDENTVLDKLEKYWPLKRIVSSGVVIASIFAGGMFIGSTFQHAELSNLNEIQYLSTTRGIADDFNRVEYKFTENEFGILSNSYFAMVISAGSEGGQEFETVIYRESVEQQSDDVMLKLASISDARGDVSLLLPVRRFPPANYKVELLINNSGAKEAKTFRFSTTLN